MRSIRTLFIHVLILLTCCIISCTNHKFEEELDHAESLMETHPDSALIHLNQIKKSKLVSKKELARYSLLMSMALDKNFIDTITFDVLQPAIEYYLENGNANDKLRTYYYQGRIFQNQGNREHALNSFLNGIYISKESNDSLVLARTLVAQGGIYNEFYDFESYTQCHLNAAQIYKNLSYTWHEFDCLLNALNGAITLGNKNRGDSILYICNQFTNLDSNQKLALDKYRLSYASKFNNLKEINSLIKRLKNNSNFDSEILLNLAYAYDKVGNDIKAKHLLDSINLGYSYDTLKYLAISVHVLENIGNYKEALKTYKNFSQTMDSINASSG